MERSGLVNFKMEMTMKRKSVFYAACAAIAAFAVSCAKAETEGPAGGLSDGKGKRLVFEAEIGVPQTKTMLGEPVTGSDGSKTVHVLWESGDVADVYWSVDGTAHSASGEVEVNPETGKATLSVEVPEDLADDTVFYAVYPGGTEAELAPEDGGEIRLAMPTVTGTFKRANIMVARCSSFTEHPAFAFRHACSMIRFETGDHAFNGGNAVKRISIFNGNRTRFNGNVSFVFEDDATVSVSGKNLDGDKYVTAGNVEPNSECYVAFLPDTEFENGFIANFYNEQLSSYTTQNITVARGEILNIGNIEARLDRHRDFYFKPQSTGTGDASSWENAGDIATFREIVTEVEDGDAAYAQRLKLDNTNYHFMEGEYRLATGEDDVYRFALKYTVALRAMSTPLNIYGGYSSADPSVRDPQNHETRFTGNGDCAILSVHDNVILTLDGIVFENAAAENARDKDGMLGAALYVNRSDSGKNLPEIHIDGCVFRNNSETQNLQGSYGGGSAINLRGGKVYVNNTLFKGNQSYSRGVVCTGSKTDEGSVLYFNSCRFTGNTVASGYSSVMKLESKDTKVGLNGCTFGHNDSEKTGGYLSTLFALSPCVFTNNTIIEDCSYYSGASSPNTYGIIRINYTAATAGSSAVFANNIIMCIKGNNSMFYKDSTNPASYLGFMKNIMTKISASASNLDTANPKVDLAGEGTDFRASSRYPVQTTNLENLEWSSDEYLWTWSGNVTGISNWNFTNATAGQMISAVKANPLIGDDFYNWLESIGAVANGRFTDCRGYLRPAGSMCPGAYDPDATPEAL